MSPIGCARCARKSLYARCRSQECFARYARGLNMLALLAGLHMLALLADLIVLALLARGLCSLCSQEVCARYRSPARCARLLTGKSILPGKTKKSLYVNPPCPFLLVSINSLNESPSPDSYSLRVARAWSGERKVEEEDMVCACRCRFVSLGWDDKFERCGYTFSEPEEEDRPGGWGAEECV